MWPPEKGLGLLEAKCRCSGRRFRGRQNRRILNHAGSTHEDDSRVRDRTAARNLALLRKIALNIVGRDKTTKASVRARRKKAAWNDAYMLKLLAGWPTNPVCNRRKNLTRSPCPSCGNADAAGVSSYLKGVTSNPMSRAKCFHLALSIFLSTCGAAS
jgi:hypothetical protein